MRRLGLASVLMAGVLIAGVAPAQTTMTEPKEVIGNGGVNHMLRAAPVIGQPFSAEQVQKTAKQLEDGTSIKHFGRHFFARDQDGRVRVEQPCGCKEGEVVVEVYVLDPVARTLTTWKTGPGTPKVAMVTKLPETLMEPQPKPVRMAPAENGRPQPVITTEEMPSETIDNLPMTVTKVTTIVPAGRSGNDAAITKTHEVWTSSDLKLTFRERWTDPRAATRTLELAKFSRAEPDPKLFRAPSDYQMKDVKQMAKELADKLAQM